MIELLKMKDNTMYTVSQEQDRLLRVDDVAIALAVSGSAVRLWIRVGAIPYIRLPRGGYRIRQSVLNNLLQEKGCESHT
jgi:excisionase family DNA binding protein